MGSGQMINELASIKHAQPESQSAVSLEQTPNGLTLVGDGMELRGDFSKMLKRVKHGKLQTELLIKAAKIKRSTDDSAGENGRRPLAIDATAGLGEDSFLLAAARFDVIMLERDETIAALLADALVRAQYDPATAEIISHMSLATEDSIATLGEWANARSNQKPDVILLDPMFPKRTKSASVKKKFQLLHELESPCSEEEPLLKAAFSANPSKIVIKRPAKGPYLAGVKPSYSVSGKAVRYDVIVTAQTRNPFSH